MSMAEVDDLEVEYAYDLYKKCTDEKTGDEIFLMQLEGIDPMKIPKYQAYIEEKEREIEPQKASLSPEEAYSYKNIFDRFLKDK
jgi:hypothetical protein